MTEHPVFDFGEYTEEQVDQAAVFLLRDAIESAEAFIQTPTQLQQETGISDLTSWLAHLVELSLPMVKVAEYLPPAVLELFQDYIQKLNKRLELAITEANARQKNMN